MKRKRKSKLKIAILTSGGDCPGLNAVIRGVVRTAAAEGVEVIGFEDGYLGLVENRTVPLYDDANIDRILRHGGTILGTGRLHPDKFRASIDQIKANLAEHGVDALIPIGGDGTLRGAKFLYESGIPVVGVPQTIDNDVDGMDYTFGFDSAVSVATEAIDRLHTTAESHQRVMIVEVMGRNTGWIALHAGMAGGAHDVLLPEFPFDIDLVCRRMEQRFEQGERYGIICVAEGAKPLGGNLDGTGGGGEELDEFGHAKLKGMGNLVATAIEKRLGVDVRSSVLGHVQRGGTPTAFDRVLASRCGINAARAVIDGHFGTVAALHGEKIKLISLDAAVDRVKTVPEYRYKNLQGLLG